MSRGARTAAALGVLLAAAGAAPARAALRFAGTGAGDADRVKLRVDDPRTARPGPRLDVGAGDFTVEWWLRAPRGADGRGRPGCGDGVGWITGHVVLDRDRYDQGRKWGVSVGPGLLAFGVTGAPGASTTACAVVDVLDGRWHHVAVDRRRADGRLRIWVDGRLGARVDGPDGDVSYPDDGVPLDRCGGPCVRSDPFLVLGAEKHDAGPAYPSFRGSLAELRVSRGLRYRARFARPRGPFRPDARTVALYHLAERAGVVAHDASRPARGRTHGVVRRSAAGWPRWTAAAPWSARA